MSKWAWLQITIWGFGKDGVHGHILGELVRIKFVEFIIDLLHVIVFNAFSAAMNMQLVVHCTGKGIAVLCQPTTGQSLNRYSQYCLLVVSYNIRNFMRAKIAKYALFSSIGMALDISVLGWHSYTTTSKQIQRTPPTVGFSCHTFKTIIGLCP